MDDAALLRYSRHILLPEIGIEGQQRIREAHVLLIGAGGLGSAVALYLVAGGVSKLTVCDNDSVDVTNLQRQIVHDEASVGLNKAVSAQRRLAALNPQVQVEAVTERVAGPLLDGLVATADVVVDASDNFATRHAVNQTCVAFKKPLVSGAAVAFDGQFAVFDARHDSGCYHCVFPDTGLVEEVRCATNGVFAPLVGIIGSMQANEALKLSAGLPTTLANRLLLLDARSMSWREVRYRKDPGCKVCSPRNSANQ